MKKTAILIATALILFSCGRGERTGERPMLWPAGDWQMATPESQGLSSETLAALLEHIRRRKLDIDSIQIIRNGRMILDTSIHPFSELDHHAIYSCTKSISSLLIGIAIDRGFIEGVDQPVLDFFPEKTGTNDDEGWKRMTIRHLLTMSTGLNSRDSYLYGWEGLNAMRESDRPWSDYILDLGFDAEPGSRFDYSNMASYLLSCIITKSTGMTAQQFAEKELFVPLGIKDVLWPSSPEGDSIGWGEIEMHPRDLCRIGHLVLNGGVWEDKRIISEDYLNQATSSQVETGSYGESYGFQWWVKQPGLFMALGYGGQSLIVHPEKNLVVLFTSALRERDYKEPMNLYNHFILKALVSDTPLEEAPESLEKLKAVQKTLYSPEPGAVPEFPEELADYDGVLYELGENPYNIRTIRYRFKADSAAVTLDFGEGPESYGVGLDGRYLINEAEGIAVRGLWKDGPKLEVRFKCVSEAWWFDLKSVFYHECVHIVIRSSNGEYMNIQGERSP